MNYSNSALIEQLRAARISFGLSQRELGARVGLPQSNIARLESGKTDPRLSNILELARALDLDIKLVPRKALPIVEGALRASQLSLDPDDATSRAMHWLRQISDEFRQLAPSEGTGTESLRETLSDLGQLHFNQKQFHALQDALKPVRRIIEEMPADWERRLQESNARLRTLRNQWARDQRSDQARLKPAFSLNDADAE